MMRLSTSQKLAKEIATVLQDIPSGAIIAAQDTSNGKIMIITSVEAEDHEDGSCTIWFKGEEY